MTLNLILISFNFFLPFIFLLYFLFEPNIVSWSHFFISLSNLSRLFRTLSTMEIGIAIGDGMTPHCNWLLWAGLGFRPKNLLAGLGTY